MFTWQAACQADTIGSEWKVLPAEETTREAPQPRASDRFPDECQPGTRRRCLVGIESSKVGRPRALIDDNIHKRLKTAAVLFSFTASCQRHGLDPFCVPARHPGPPGRQPAGRGSRRSLDRPLGRRSSREPTAHSFLPLKHPTPRSTRPLASVPFPPASGCPPWPPTRMAGRTHFNSPETRKLGQRYAEQMLKLQGK